MGSDTSVVFDSLRALLLVVTCPIAPGAEHTEDSAHTEVHHDQAVELSEDECNGASDQGNDSGEEKDGILVQSTCDFVGHACVCKP